MRVVEILLVEDNPGDVRLTQEALSEAKVQNRLTVARDGVEAIDYLVGTQAGESSGDNPIPDLVLLDLNLPRKNGHEVLTWIKTHENLKTVPVVVLSTSSAESDIRRAYENCGNSYVTKPLDFFGYVKVIAEISQFWFGTAQLPTRMA